MSYFRYLWLGLIAFIPTFGAVTQEAAPSYAAVAVSVSSTDAPAQRKSWIARLKDTVRSAWTSLKERLKTAADDLIRLLIIAIIVALIVSIVVWLLPWPLDVLIMVIALVVLLIFLLRYLS